MPRVACCDTCKRASLPRFSIHAKAPAEQGVIGARMNGRGTGRRDGCETAMAESS